MYFSEDCHDDYEYDEVDEDNTKKKRKPLVRVKWTQKENQEIKKYFHDNLETHVIPGKRECEAAMEKSKESGGVIHKRYWETIKKKVWNMLQRR